MQAYPNPTAYPAYGAYPAYNAYPTYSGTPVRSGSRGNNVALIQNALDALSAAYPSIPFVTADGNFGPDTEKQVIAFQNLFSLTPDGVVGLTTWKAIMDSQNGAAPPPLPKPDFPGYPLRAGTNGDEILTFQKALNVLSLQYPSIPTVTADGVFGPDTKAAVIAAQRLFGLIPDGIVGADTWNAVVKGQIPGTPTTPPNPVTPVVPPNPGVPSAPAYPGALIRQGSSGESVRTLQNYINQMAKGNPYVPMVVADGMFGPATKAAVISAQSVLGLTVDGIVGPATWAAVVK